MTERLSVDELHRVVRKRHKYSARRCTVDGHTFPSQREARRYRELALLARAGDILNLELQPAWVLHAPGGCKVCRYIADFRYIVASTGETVTEDAKGMKTPVYRLKKKWLLAEHGIAVREV